jgi:autotransporter-associated beta strand protein
MAAGTTLQTNSGNNFWFVPILTLEGNISMNSGSRLRTTFGTLELGDATRAMNVNNRFRAVTGGNTVEKETTGEAQLEMNGTAIQAATPVIQNGVLSLQSTSASATPSNPALLSIHGNTVWSNASLIIGPNNMLMLNSASSFVFGSTATNAAVTVEGYLNLAASFADNKNIRAHSLEGSGQIFASMLASNTRSVTLTLLGDSNDSTFSGVMANGPGTGTLSFTKSGEGIQTLSGVNIHTGPTTVTAGTLALSGSGTLGAGANLTMTGGTLDLGTGSATVGAVSITSAATLANGSLTGLSYAASNASGNAVVSANLLPNDTAGLIKTGAGTLTLSATNSYTGTTAVRGGVLDVGPIAGGSLSGSGLTLGNGAVLQGNGEFTRSFSNSLVPGDGQVSANNGTASSPGGFSAKGGPLIVNFGGAGASLQINSGSFRFGQGMVFGSSTADDKVTVVNQLNLGNGNRTFTVNSGLGGDYAEISNGIVDTGLDQIFGPIKAGSGLLVLKGLNQYGGNTLVNAGTLELAADAKLTFYIGADSGINNRISGAGEVVLNGDFIINTSAAAALTTGTWLLEDVDTLTEAYGSSFSVDGFVDAGNDQWTKTSGTQAWTFDETTGELTLAVGSASNYAAWANDPSKGNIPGEPASGDFDNDGISNLMEYALGKNPRVSSQPAGVLSNNLITFTKGADAIANGDVSWVIETSTTLATGSWTPQVTQAAGDTAPTIEYTLTPGSPAQNFARLKTSQP